MRVVVDLNKCQGTRSASRWLPRCSGSSAKRHWPTTRTRRVPTTAGVARGGLLPGAGHHPGTGPARGPGHPVNGTYRLDEVVAKFRAEGRIAIVGRLAGRACARRRRCGTRASKAPDHHRRRAARTVRPSAAVQTGAQGWVPADHQAAAATPGGRRLETRGRRGRPGPRQPHRQTRQREDVEYDRLLIATGTGRGRGPTREGALQGVFTVRTVEDAAALAAALRAGPNRVLVVGSGFVGSEIASVCRDLDLPSRWPSAAGPADGCAGRGDQ